MEERMKEMVEKIYHTSVIVPVYNVEDYLRTCIESILAQTVEGYELILIDDGSTDASPAIMQEYARKYEHITVYRQENKKLGAARNAGIERAKGEYILFVDSDDCIARNCLEVLYKKAKRNNLDVLLYDARTFKDDEFDINIDEDKQYDRSELDIPQDKVFEGYDFFETYMPRSGMTVSACLHYVNIDFLLKHGIYFREHVFYEDNAYALQIYKAAKRLMYCSEKMYMRRYRPNSIIFSKITDTHINGTLMMLSDSVLQIMDMENERGRGEGTQFFLRTKLRELSRRLSHYPIEDIIDRSWIEEFWITMTAIDTDYVCNRVSREVRYLLLDLYKNGALNREWKLSDELHIAVTKKYKALVKKTEEVFFRHFSEEDRIAIYGIGKNTEILIRDFIDVCPDLKKRIVFVTTDEPKETYYKGIAPIVSIYNIENMSVNGIVVSSTRYEEDMFATIAELYGDKYPCCTFSELMEE